MKPLYVVAGHLCVALGIVGIILPVLPTTPFILLAAWCYSKGSDRLHSWIIEHRQFGPMILRFRKHGAITGQAKAVAIGMISLAVSATFLSAAPDFAKYFTLSLCAGVVVYIATRPSGPAEIDLR